MKHRQNGIKSSLSKSSQTFMLRYYDMKSTLKNFLNKNGIAQDFGSVKNLKILLMPKSLSRVKGERSDFRPVSSFRLF